MPSTSAAGGGNDAAASGNADAYLSSLSVRELTEVRVCLSLSGFRFGLVRSSLP